MRQAVSFVIVSSVPKVVKMKVTQFKQSSIYVKVGLGVIAALILYILAVGLISSPSTDPYKPEPLDAAASNQEKAAVIARGVTSALDQSLSSFFGWLPNDLIAPWFLDNTANYQRGVIYATRPASEIVAHEVGRFGNRDTLDPRLANATSRFFSYSENVWGFLFIYDAEGKYKAGIKNWADWVNSIGTEGKKAGVYNLRSDDVYSIIQYCVTMTEYALGVLNTNNMSHFQTDNNVYYAKGVCAVTANLFRAILAVDASIYERGGKENVEEALNRFNLIDEFNPIYVMAGGNKVGDAMMPNHIAALARHIDIVNNRLGDILSTMAR